MMQVLSPLHKFRHGHRVLPTSSSSSSSLLSWRLTCQLKPAVVSGGDHRGTINRRQGPSSRGRISLTCNWPWVPANQTQHSYFFSKKNWSLNIWIWMWADVPKNTNSFLVFPKLTGKGTEGCFFETGYFVFHDIVIFISISYLRTRFCQIKEERLEPSAC